MMIPVETLSAQSKLLLALELLSGNISSTELHSRRLPLPRQPEPGAWSIDRSIPIMCRTLTHSLIHSLGKGYDSAMCMHTKTTMVDVFLWVGGGIRVRGFGTVGFAVQRLTDRTE